jgi:hypothetical protein
MKVVLIILAILAAVSAAAYGIITKMEVIKTIPGKIAKKARSIKHVFRPYRGHFDY